MDENLQVDIAILDFSKAFDKVAHNDIQDCYTNWNIMGLGGKFTKLAKLISFWLFSTSCG